jgi:hypothetical protein
MDIPIGNFVATGGVTGAVVVVCYMIYRLCENKKFKSSCCGATVEVKEDTATPQLVIRKPEPDKPKEEV